MTLNHFPQLLNGYNCDVAVNHCVAVRANRTQIGNRVNLILSANLGQCLEMVDVNKAAAKLAIRSLEIEAANRTPATVVLNALLACLRIALVAVDGDLTGGTFKELRRSGNLIGL